MGRKRQKTESDDDSSSSEACFIVEKILDKKLENGVEKYLVKWLDFAVDESTWEPKENLTSCIETIEEFEDQLRNTKPKIKKEKSTTTKLTINSASRNIKKHPSERKGFFVDEIIGITDIISEINPNAKWMFLMKFSDGTYKLMERKVANVKCPQLVIGFYQKRLVFGNKK